MVKTIWGGFRIDLVFLFSLIAFLAFRFCARIIFQRCLEGSTQSKQCRIYIAIELLFRYKRAKTSKITVLSILNLYKNYTALLERIIVLRKLCMLRPNLDIASEIWWKCTFFSTHNSWSIVWNIHPPQSASDRWQSR